MDLQDIEVILNVKTKVEKSVLEFDVTEDFTMATFDKTAIFIMKIVTLFYQAGRFKIKLLAFRKAYNG